MIQDCGDGGCSGAFGQRFLALQQQENRVCDFFFFHGNNVVHIFLNQGKRAFSGAAYRDSVGDRFRGLQGDGFALGHCGFHGRNPGGLNSEDLHSRISFLDGAGDSADESTAADGRYDDLDVGMLLQNFESESSLPGDDRVVVEGMNQGQTFLLALLDGLFVGLVIVGPVQHDLRAIGASRRNFGERCGERHHDSRLNLMASRVVSDPLRMIAGRCGDHTAGTFIMVKSEQFVQRSPLFESAGALLIIELEEDRIVGKPGKCLRVGAGRDANVRPNSVERGLDVRKLDHDAGAGILPRSILARSILA